APSVARHGSCGCHGTMSQRPIAILILMTLFTVGMAFPTDSAGDDAPSIDEAQQNVEEDYDPWQRFNEKMFFFNHDILDRYLVKPVATGWSKIVPDSGKHAIDRLFDNLAMPKRLVNNLLQGRFLGAGRELARFGVNTTVGVIGLFDVAGAQLHIE